MANEKDRKMKTIGYFKLMKELEKLENIDLDSIDSNIPLLEIFLRDEFVLLDYETSFINLTEKGLNSTMDDVEKLLLKYDIKVA